MKKALIGLIVSGVVISGFGSSSVAAPAVSACPLSVVPRGPGWTSIDRPDFQTLQDLNGDPLDTRDSVAYAIDEADPQRIFVSNTNEVFRSVDGGCSWKKVYVTPMSDTPVLDCGPTGADLSAVASPGCVRIYDLDLSSSGRLFLQQYVTRAYGVPPTSLVMTSDDGGDSWNRLDPAGAPALTVGHGVLVVAPSDPATIYVARGEHYQSNAGVATSLLVSHDGGVTWETLAPPDMPERHFLSTEILAVDPTNPKALWAAAVVPDENDPGRAWPNRLVRSEDAGATWHQVPNPADLPTGPGVASISDVSVSHPIGRPAQIAVSNYHRVFLSRDGGANWVDAISTGTGGLLTDIEFNEQGTSLFGVENAAYAWRYDLKKEMGYSIKNRAFSSDNATDGQRLASFVRGAGLFMLGACRNGQYGCAALYRYTGKGT